MFFQISLAPPLSEGNMYLEKCSAFFFRKIMKIRLRNGIWIFRYLTNNGLIYKEKLLVSMCGYCNNFSNIALISSQKLPYRSLVNQWTRNDDLILNVAMSDLPLKTNLVLFKMNERYYIFCFNLIMSRNHKIVMRTLYIRPYLI